MSTPFRRTSHYQNRFGIKGYCHPEIEQQLLELSPDAKVRDHIYDTLFTGGKGQVKAWKGKAEELVSKLSATVEGEKLLRSVKGRFDNLLSRLASADPEQFKRKKNNTERYWVIEPPAVSEI